MKLQHFGLFSLCSLLCLALVAANEQGKCDVPAHVVALAGEAMHGLSNSFSANVFFLEGVRRDDV